MYEIKANLGKNLFYNLDEIVFKLAVLNFKATHKEVLEVIQDDKRVKLLSLNEIIKEIKKHRE